MTLRLPLDFSDGDTLPAGDVNKILTQRTGIILPINNTTRDYETGTCDIGSLTYKFNDIFLSGTASIGELVSAGENANYQSIFGRARIGYDATIGSDIATFGHYDATGAKIALCQDASGKTYLNCADGQSITIRENNSEIINISESSGNAILVVASGKYIQIEDMRVDGGVVTNLSSLTATSLTGTLQTAAQTNITSLGTLTSLTVDNLVINENDISSSSGDITLSPAVNNDVVIDGHWEFDGPLLTALTDADTVITPYSGKKIQVNGAFDVTGALSAGSWSVGSLTVDNLVINENDISSSSGDINITPVAGSAIVLDSQWEFDGPLMTAGGGVVAGISNIYTTDWTAWTPNFAAASGGTPPVYFTVNGYYKKIGKFVYWYIYATGDGGAEGNGADEIIVDNLPVRPAAYLVNYHVASGSGRARNSTTYTSLLPWAVYSSGTGKNNIYFEKAALAGYLVCNDQNNATREIKCSGWYESYS